MLAKSSSVGKALKNGKKKPAHYRTQSSDVFIKTTTNKKKKINTKKPRHKRAASSQGYQLVPLAGKNIIKAPRIYNNQIFSDIYDEEGNHDRIVELSSDTDRDFNYQQQYIVPELLQLPTVGRNLYNTKKIIFY
ncbi:hypothetical protein SteCoe_6979 [Stentor coeruleus]|uniref:Uncharacterized protein n=1 Tax=Stentor coeruleus TaxID=5963 RepID=A0A1R2CNI9_9CILI|nr:hypothetical protein SteCoe_6979 [Stentor coeruleus]